MQKLVLVIARALALTRSVAQDSRFWLATTIRKAQQILGRPMPDSLTDILKATIEFDRVEEALCFDPHQAIVWSKDGKLSYIDCCFHCLRYVASSDLTPLMGKNFGYRKWAMLERFFGRQGLLAQ